MVWIKDFEYQKWKPTSFPSLNQVDLRMNKPTKVICWNSSRKSDVSMYTIHALHADFYWPLYSLGDICRVCRCEGTAERPLFHPCICTGSIKYIHQECLLQWLKYSKKEFCELCSHRFSFTPSKKIIKFSVISIEFVLTHVNWRIFSTL